jgi:5-methylcytosine-specific restriction endonuclease McrA
MVDYIAPTKRRPMTKARAAKIFLRENGCCYLCSRKLRVGVDKYQIEHPDPLSLGGSDNDDDLRVVCIECHKPKTAADAAEKARRDRIVASGWSGAAKPKWGSRGFPSRPKQHTATRPIERRKTFKREEVK